MSIRKYIQGKSKQQLTQDKRRHVLTHGKSALGLKLGRISRELTVTGKEHPIIKKPKNTKRLTRAKYIYRLPKQQKNAFRKNRGKRTQRVYSH